MECRRPRSKRVGRVIHETPAKNLAHCIPYIEKKDSVAEMNKHLQMFRATPHVTTSETPASMMFGFRKYKTRIPLYKTPCRDQLEEVAQARLKDKKNKEKQKRAKDSKQYVREHSFQLGDSVLLAQRKTKMNPPYDPVPYTITQIQGHHITATRTGRTLTRDAQKWKLIKERKRTDYATNTMFGGIHTDSKDEFPFTPPSNNGCTEEYDHREREISTENGAHATVNENDTIESEKATNQQEIRIGNEKTPRRNPQRDRQLPIRYR